THQNSQPHFPRQLANWRVAIALAAALLFVTGPVMAATVSVLRAQLENGRRVVNVPNHLAPVASTMRPHDAGSNEAPQGTPGRGHDLEHMMFRGSRGLSAQQLSAISAALGGRFNACSRRTATHYYFTVPSDDLPVALHIQAIRMQNVLLTEKSWKKERGAIE